MVEFMWEVGSGFFISLMTALRGNLKIQCFINVDLCAILDV